MPPSFPFEFCIALDIVSTSEPIPLSSDHLTLEKSEVVEFSWCVLHFDGSGTPQLVHSHREIVKPPTLPVTSSVTKDTGITQAEVDVRGATLAEAVTTLDRYVASVIGTKSVCIVTYGRWDIPVVLRHAVEEENKSEDVSRHLTLLPYIYRFFDLRDIFLWAHDVIFPQVKPKSSSLQSICEAFRVEASLSHQMTGYQYASMIAEAVIKICEAVSSRGGDDTVYPSPLDWLSMLKSFQAEEGTLIRVVDLPFTATTGDVRAWLLEMGVHSEPILCKRELHIERLRPSGTAFMKFEKHEDALTLVLNRGVKMAGRMPYIESTTEEIMARSTIMAFPPDVKEFEISGSTVLRLGSLFWDTSTNDIAGWCYSVTGSSLVGAWMASLPDGRSTGVGWVKFGDSASALLLLQTSLRKALPRLYDREVIVDPSDDAEIEFARSITVLSPFPHWIYLPVPISCVGLIIGKQGQRISNIGKNWKVKIHAPRRGDQPIFSIFGTPQRLAGAKEEIDRIIHQWIAENSSATGGPTGSNSGATSSNPGTPDHHQQQGNGHGYGPPQYAMYPPPPYGSPAYMPQPATPTYRYDAYGGASPYTGSAAPYGYGSSPVPGGPDSFYLGGRSPQVGPVAAPPQYANGGPPKAYV